MVSSASIPGSGERPLGKYRFFQAGFTSALLIKNRFIQKPHQRLGDCRLSRPGLGGAGVAGGTGGAGGAGGGGGRRYDGGGGLIPLAIPPRSGGIGGGGGGFETFLPMYFLRS